MSDGQQYLERNRPGRVRIRFEVNLDGANKKIELPFIVGVMADLSGNAGAEKADVGDRDFVDVSANTINQFMETSVRPRVSFRVKNKLTNEGNLDVDLDFKSMDDFSPAAIARKVEPLRELFETREQLQELVRMSGGKAKAQKFLATLLKDDQFLKSVADELKSRDGDAGGKS